MRLWDLVELREYIEMNKHFGLLLRTRVILAIVTIFSGSVQAIESESSILEKLLQTSCTVGNLRPGAVLPGNVSPVNVVSFGAKGNGMADDSRSINAAICAAYAMGGGIVYLPPSNKCYALATPILLRSGIILRGATSGDIYAYPGTKRPSELCPLESFKGTAIIKADPSNYSNNPYISGIGVEDLTIDSEKYMNWTKQNVWGLELLSTSHPNGFRNIHILNHNGGFVHIAPSGGVVNDDGASMYIGSNTIYSSKAIFNGDDVNKFISVFGAGTSSNVLITTIKKVESPYKATLAESAKTTVNNTRWNYGWLESDGVVIENMYARSVPALVSNSTWSYPQKYGVLIDGCLECVIRDSKFLRYTYLCNDDPVNVSPCRLWDGKEAGSAGIAMLPIGNVGHATQGLAIQSVSISGFETGFLFKGSKEWQVSPSAVDIRGNTFEGVHYGIKIGGGGPSIPLVGMFIPEQRYNQVVGPDKRALVLDDYAAWNRVDCGVTCYYSGGVLTTAKSSSNRIYSLMGREQNLNNNPTNIFVYSTTTKDGLVLESYGDGVNHVDLELNAPQGKHARIRYLQNDHMWTTGVAGDSSYVMSYKDNTDSEERPAITIYSNGNAYFSGSIVNGAGIAEGSPKGNCDTIRRGEIYFEKGVQNVADQLFICVKETDGGYAWMQLTKHP